MKKILLTGLLLAIIQVCMLAQPAGYYDNAAGKSGEQLQQALHDIIDDHTVRSYDYLWTAFYTTDDKPDGKVWDMYSDNPDGAEPYEYTFGSDQCGNYSGEGSCYNREHSFPKSWFGGTVAPMYSDLFHLYPTDGQVNGYRANLPYGETESPTRTTLNGSKVGPCSVDGYTGTIFEPIDEYKGDFARSYFYMATRYYGEDSNWPGSPMVDGSQLKPWAEAMLLQWHEEDPVSTKEVERNDAVYAIQNNRNPFIDHSEYVQLIYEGETPPADELPPVLDSISVISYDSLCFWFNEALAPESIVDILNYSINAGVTVLNAEEVPGNSNAVKINVSGLINGTYNVIINGISDTAGNEISSIASSFSVNIVSVLIRNLSIPLIYPNPSQGDFIVKFPGNAQDIQWISLNDMSGRELSVDFYKTGEGIRVRTSLRPGVYHLNITLSKGQRMWSSLMIQ